MRLRKSEYPGSPCDVEGSLPAHGIDDVFDNGGEPCPLGSIMQMTQTKVPFDDISFLRYFFVPLDFIFGQFCCGRIFSHDSILNMVEA